MSLLLKFVDFMRHLDKHLPELAQNMGPSLYFLLFAIIFAETGLVIFPILPGDSLLFAVGVLCAMDGTPLSLPLVCITLLLAAILGDAVNYQIGKAVGPRVFSSQSSRLLNKKHLEKTQAFYEKYGNKTIIIARFVPIVRTFAPFVAGIGQMSYRRFFVFNVIGATLWVLLLVPAGYFFADTPLVKKNFELVVLAIIFLSILPAIIEFARERRKSARSASTALEP